MSKRARAGRRNFRKHLGSAKRVVASRQTAAPRRVRHSLWAARLGLFGVLVVLQSAACQFRESDERVAARECDAYVSSVSRCTGANNPMIEPTRKNLEAQIRDATGDQQKLDALATQCRGGRHTVEEACR